MDRGPAGVDGAGPRTPGVRGSRRLIAIGTAAVVVLLGVIAVLATRLADAPPAARAATPRPASTPTGLTVPAIYQRLAPSVVLVRTAHDLGTGVIVADDGTILTANHVIAGGATLQRAVEDQFYGDRSGSLIDPFGHLWSIAIYKKDLTPNELKKAAVSLCSQ
jgi:hypothetical protein